MFTSPFFRRLFLPYLLLICAATAAVGFVAARTVYTSYLDRQTESLQALDDRPPFRQRAINRNEEDNDCCTLENAEAVCIMPPSWILPAK